MSEPIFFSIVVPVFNSKTFIEANILSLTKLEFPTDKFEVIFVDDGSSDNSLSAIEGFLEFHHIKFSFQLLKNTATLGPGIARNIGVTNAKGEWIIFLDSDDQLTSDSLRELANHIQIQESMSGVDLVFFDGIAFGAQGEVLKEICKHECLMNSSSSKKNLVVEIKSILRLEFDEHVIFCTFKKEFLKANEISFTSGIYEDILFISRSLILSKTSMHLDKILYKKFSRANQITGSFTLKHAEKYLHSRQGIWEWLKVNSEISIGDFAPDYCHGVRGALGILYRTSADEISPEYRNEFDTQLTRVAIGLFEDLAEIIHAPLETKLDEIAYSRFREIVALGKL
jgi:glycosyltransferase involved in cell wall biosynthesis